MTRSLTPLLLATACLLALTFASTATAASPASSSLLMTQAATHGTFEPVAGHRGRYTLALRGVQAQTIWFTDRPERHAGEIGTRNFARAWKSLGFGSDHPNAAVSIIDGRRSADTMVVELSHPRYDAKRHIMRYRARKLGGARGGLIDFQAAHDGRVPRRFGAVSLFIDSAAGSGLWWCMVSRYTGCVGADLSNANGAFANLSYANLSNANLSFANLSYANLSFANLTGANLSYANLLGTVLTGANLTEADLSGTPPFGPRLKGAKFCRTRMPDQTINNSGC